MKKPLFLLSSAIFISELGSAMTTAVLPVLYVKANLKEGAAIYNGIDAIGALFGSTWVMTYIDRFRKNRIAVFSDLIRALALLPLVLSDQATLPTIMIYAFIQSIFASANFNAIQAWLVEKSQDPLDLKKINSSLEIASKVAAAIAPLIGVAILSRFALNVIFAVDALTYVVGAALVFRLKSHIPPLQKTSAWKEIRDGFSYCIRNPKILRWISISSLQGVGLAIMNTVYLWILADSIGANEQQIAFFQAAYFIGALLAGSYGFVSGRSLTDLLRWSNWALAFVMLTSIFTKNYWLFFALAILQKGATLLGAICTRSLCQSNSTLEVSGRVMAFRSATIDVVGILSYAASISLFQFVPVPALLVVACLAFVIAAMR